jgi:hypothetical protein
MIEVYVFIALALIGAGAVLGTVMVLAAGIHREQMAARRAWPDRGFTTECPTRLASGIRAANGLHVCKPLTTQQASSRRPDLAA